MYIARAVLSAGVLICARLWLECCFLSYWSLKRIFSPAIVFLQFASRVIV